jgi:hypothetical protein
MSPLRRLLINGFILGFLVLYAFTILDRREGWPICNYPMFAAIENWADLERPEFFVVRGNREVRLLAGHHSMAAMCLEYSVPHFVGGNDWRSGNAKTALTLILGGLVDEWNAGGKPSGEPTALRVYQVTYHFPRLGDPTPKVISKTLLLEVGRTSP